LPAGQPSPQGPALEQIETTPEELKNVGAIKRILGELAEAKAAHKAAVAELKIERDRNESLSAKASSYERDRCVLQERLGCSGHRDHIEALIIVVIIALLTFAVDFARSGNWESCAVLVILTLILLGVIHLVRRGRRPQKET
jgi:hypothetical protein